MPCRAGSFEQNKACSIPGIAYNCVMDLSVKQLEEAVAVRKQIDQLRNRLNNLLGGSSVSSAAVVIATASVPRKRGGLSAAGRARIAAAARARWARAKAAGQTPSKAKGKSKKSGGKKKGGISAAGRRKLSQMMKARWAARRRAQG